MILDIILPRSWRELDEEDLVYISTLYSMFDMETSKKYFLLRKAGIELEEENGRVFKFKKGEHHFSLSLDEMSRLDSLSSSLSWMDKLDAVRPDILEGRKAVHPLLQEDFTFYEYLRCEGFFQQYLTTKHEKYLHRLSDLLYRKASGSRELSSAGLAMVLMWYQGIKNRLAEYFPYYFMPASSDEDAPINMMEITDIQIRALSGGDITKEQQILDTQCWRALSELNAKAHDAEELKKLTSK